MVREWFSLLGFNPVYYLAWQTNTLILLTVFILHLAYSVYRESFVAHFHLLWLKVVSVFSCVIRIISARHNFFIGLYLPWVCNQSLVDVV